jgi:hypothetical protein
MSTEGDFFWGLIKPTKDFITAYVINLVLSNLSSTPQPFNIYLFVVIWGFISLIDDAISGYFIDLNYVKIGYYDNIKAIARIIGMIIGIIFFYFLLALSFGATVFDAIGTVMIPITCMALGLILRMSMSTRIKLE